MNLMGRSGDTLENGYHTPTSDYIVENLQLNKRTNWFYLVRSVWILTIVSYTLDTVRKAETS
jgi:p-aminobenzoyl-glutamate transporter AbgT